jgi:hypothetical protein
MTLPSLGSHPGLPLQVGAKPLEEGTQAIADLPRQTPKVPIPLLPTQAMGSGDSIQVVGAKAAPEENPLAFLDFEPATPDPGPTLDLESTQAGQMAQVPEARSAQRHAERERPDQTHIGRKLDVVPESREKPPGGQGSHAWVWVGAALLALAAGGAYYSRKDRPRRIHVQSEPAGAEVLVAGRVVGRTPFAGSVAPEADRFQVRWAGHRTFEGPLPVGETPAVIRLEPEGVTMTVLSDPEGAKVFVDREWVGTTPLRDFRMVKPRAFLQLEKEGFITYVGNLERGRDLGTITLKPQSPEDRRRK